MDLAFNAEERAFEKEVREFIAANLTPEMKRATALTPSVVVGLLTKENAPRASAC